MRQPTGELGRPGPFASLGLDESYRRRGTPALVRRAVARGWLESADRAVKLALVTVLEDLLDEPTLTRREQLAVIRIFAAMMRQDLGDHRRLRAYPSRPQDRYVITAQAKCSKAR